MRRLFVLSLMLLAPQIYAASTFLNPVDGDTTRFETSENDLQPFASTMIFKWQTVSPDIKFNLDTAGNTWNIRFNFGFYDPPNNYFSLYDLVSFDSFEVILGGLEGDGFEMNSYDHSTYGMLGGIMFQGSGYITTAISGKGSFTSISFSVNFGNVQSGQIGMMMVPWDFSTATPYASSFYIDSGEEGGGSFSVGVPEPSALSLLAVGLGGLAILRGRRS